MSVRLGTTIIAGSVSTLPVGAIFESEGTAKPNYGTWEALADRVEDNWKQQTVTFNNAWTGAISYFKLMTKISEDKQWIDLYVSFYLSATDVPSTTQEYLLANEFAINGKLLKEIGFPAMVFNFADATNSSQTACVYFNNGSNKMWSAYNKLGNFNGPVNGRFLMAYNSAFTPDKIIHRWKRTA